MGLALFGYSCRSDVAFRLHRAHALENRLAKSCSLILIHPIRHFFRPGYRAGFWFKCGLRHAVGRIGLAVSTRGAPRQRHDIDVHVSAERRGLENRRTNEHPFVGAL